MSIEWILIVASIVIIWLLLKSLFKMVLISLNTAIQIFMILVILRVFFTIMPQEVIQQINKISQLIREFLWTLLSFISNRFDMILTVKSFP